MIITISGRIGSGKSTIAKALAKKLKMAYYSTGSLVRDIAREKGMTPSELSRFIEKNPGFDRGIDRKTIELGKKSDNMVIDSRLAFHFIPQSVKIFLEADLNVSAKRVFSQKRKDEKENVSIKKTKKAIKERENSEIKRYRNAYKLDFTDHRNFDLVIDTSKMSVEKIIKKIIDFLTEKGKL